MESPDVDILLVEDNINDAELAIRSLKKKVPTCHITHLKDGADALDFLFCEGAYTSRTITQYPRAILLDLKMPKVTGLEVLRRLKADEHMQTIPVVILTSSKEDADISASYSLGANSYIVKPVDYDRFSATVGDLGAYWLSLNQAPNK